jgi:hypothetical protein
MNGSGEVGLYKYDLRRNDTAFNEFIYSPTENTGMVAGENANESTKKTLIFG